MLAHRKTYGDREEGNMKGMATAALLAADLIILLITHPFLARLLFSSADA